MDGFKHAIDKMKDFLSKENVEKYYDLKKEVGTGNFSVVRMAVNKKTGEEVAVKIIDKKRVGQKKDMLQTEVDILQTVRHPHIVELKELFETSTHIFLVMEIVMGGELFDRIVERGSFSEKDAAKITREILEAVSYLHSKGIAHRDLKPENLLCASKAPDSDIKISDFGLSKIMDPDTHMKMMTACGTPGYVAPEVLKCQGYGKEVDLWSTGVILYIMLCGFPPFYEENNALLFEKIMAGKYQFLAPYWNNISADAKDLVSKLLTVDPAKRLTAEMALKHAWIQKGGCDARVDLDKMKNYNASRKALVTKPMSTN